MLKLFKKKDVYLHTQLQWWTALLNVVVLAEEARDTTEDHYLDIKNFKIWILTQCFKCIILTSPKSVSSGDNLLLKESINLCNVGIYDYRNQKYKF